MSTRPIRYRFADLPLLAAAIVCASSRLSAAPAEGGEAPEPAQPSAQAESAAPQGPNDALIAATLNVAGFPLFGPDLNVELGRQLTGLVRVRGFGLGYLSHSMFAPEDNRELSLDSFSVGAGGRFYFSSTKGTFTGPYAGLAAEYLTVSIEETDEFGTLETTTTFLIPAIEGGYRFLLGPVLLGGGADFGYAFALDEKCTYTAGTCTVEPRENKVYGQLVLDVGVRF